MGKFAYLLRAKKLIMLPTCLRKRPKGALFLLDFLLVQVPCLSPVPSLLELSHCSCKESSYWLYVSSYAVSIEREKEKKPYNAI